MAFVFVGKGSFRNDRRTIGIEGGGANVHLAHLTVTRFFFLLLLLPFHLLSPFLFLVLLRARPYPYHSPIVSPRDRVQRTRATGSPNVRFLMAIIEILLPLNWKLMAGYAATSVVRKLASWTLLLHGTISNTP